MFNFKILTAGATSLALLASAAMSETVIRIQSVLGNSTDEVRMVEAFAADVLELTGGSVKIEILPAGAVVGPRSIIGANSLVTGGMIIPEGSLVLGSPARVVKTLDLKDQENIKSWAEKYARNCRIFKERDFEPK